MTKNLPLLSLEARAVSSILPSDTVREVLKEKLAMALCQKLLEEQVVTFEWKTEDTALMGPVEFVKATLPLADNAALRKHMERQEKVISIYRDKLDRLEKIMVELAAINTEIRATSWSLQSELEELDRLSRADET